MAASTRHTQTEIYTHTDICSKNMHIHNLKWKSARWNYSLTKMKVNVLSLFPYFACALTLTHTLTHTDTAEHETSWRWWQGVMETPRAFHGYTLSTPPDRILSCDCSDRTLEVLRQRSVSKSQSRMHACPRTHTHTQTHTHGHKLFLIRT